MLQRLATLVPAALLASACQMHFDRTAFVVDGVELEEHHEETLAVGAWSAEGLRVESHRGDVRVERTDGPNALLVTVHERTLGDAQASYSDDGVLRVASASGDPAAIGDVVVRCSTPLGALFVETGMGDVSVHDVAIERSLTLVTGMGDVRVQGLDHVEHITLATGMGGVEVDGTRCAVLEATSGMGDVDVAAVQAQRAIVGSGMGDVELAGSRFVELEATTGMGSVDCTDTHYERGELDSGLGRVRRH